MEERLPDRPSMDRMQLRISEAERQQVAEILRQAAGDGRIDLDELDERLDATWAARTYADLVPITIDLPAHPDTAMPAMPAQRPVAGGTLAPITSERHLALLGGFDRKGVWQVPVSMTVLAIMGGADLDLREATWSSHEAVFYLNAVMGGVTVIVPPDVHVIMEGTGIMGGFSGPSDRRVKPRTDANSPVLRVKGVSIMGGVEVRRKERRKRA